MADTRLVLGFFGSRDAAHHVLSQLRRERVFRAALIHKSVSGQLGIDDSVVSGRHGALLGGLAGLAGGSLLPATRRPVAGVMGAAAGFGLARALDFGVDNRTLARYRRWVVRGETLLLVEARAEQVPPILAALRAGKANAPTIYVVRPQPSRLRTSTGPSLIGEPLPFERLQAHARQLAGHHRVHTDVAPRLSLLSRLDENAAIITAATRSLGEAVRLEQPVSISAEWMLDNAYIVESHIADVRRNLTHRYYAELPLLARGACAGVPRIYAIACELLAHTDARLDRVNIHEFLAAYQEILPLTMGELWAFPLMLRLGLIENLRRLGVQVEHRQRARERADFWANRLLNAAQRDADHLVSLLADLAVEQADLQTHFAERLVSHLYDDEISLLPVQSWFEHKLDAPLRDIVQREQRRQANSQMAVANTVTSLRFLMQIDWRECFERLSLVHRVLTTDPAGVYEKTDFGTRDAYRHQVERIARRSAADEEHVARRAVELARDAAEAMADAGDISRSPVAHVGFHLQDDGQPALEAAVQYRCPPLLQARRFVCRHAAPVYFGAVGGLTLGIAFGVWHYARRGGRDRRIALQMARAAVLPASELAVQAVNYLMTRFLAPTSLPKMDFEQGIPDEFRTIVVVPMLLNNVASLQEELERLEVHFLANRYGNLRFALLADYRDAPAAHMPDDEELLETARTGIRALNARHARGAGEIAPFLLFHRERRSCASEGCFMGWERKRGKLEELNRYLCGKIPNRKDVLHLAEGDSGALQGIRFVITLDADTELPHDAARRMVETLAHPLNQPVVVPSGRWSRVARGYGIIQPRVSTSLPSATATPFARLFTDASGTDPYTHVVSDLYQDLFRAGSYHGKGIYDLRTFHDLLAGRFPPSTLLSHDLLEGGHVRVGLASDIELFDQFPPNYAAYAQRQHRWIRGDWQVAPWMGALVPAADAGIAANPLGLIDRWKLADNLRRSLLPPALLALFGTGWAGSPVTAATAGVLAALHYAFPSVANVTTWLTSRRGSVHLTPRDIAAGLMRGFVEAALLPHQAYLAVDAVTRVLWRRYVSRRSLLEWVPAQITYSRSASNRAFRWRLAGFSLASVGAGAWLLRRSHATTAATPFLFLWSMAPVIVRRLAETRMRRPGETLTPDDRRLLRGIARQTWRYFDDFVGPQTNWLPPDNYQETLRVEIAQRTSPTNIGLWLLSLQTAHDFGYITVDEVIGRALPTMHTLADLETYGGHILNWYNVQTLEPLRPRYVSTVDSGNLLVSLWTWLQGCNEMLAQPLLPITAVEGLRDTLDLLRDALGAGANEPGLHEPLQEIVAILDPTPCAVHELIGRLRRAAAATGKLAAALSVYAVRFKPTEREWTNLQEVTADPRIVISTPSYWAAHLDQQLELWLHCINRYLVWIEKLAEPPEAALLPLGDDAVALRARALVQAPSLEALARGDVPPLQELLARGKAKTSIPPELGQWLAAVEEAFSRSRWLAGEMLASAQEVQDRMSHLADDMNMRFLYNPERKLFSIGFNVDDMRLDNSYYDLLASECRLASLAAIARGQAPVEHWMTLGRRFSITNGRPLLLSWSGTMFEYLMPLIFTRSFENSLLDLACRNAVLRQQEYARQVGIPWGSSEAAFSALDVYHIYQYKAFGVPGLGLKRGLETDFIVAPYASALALMVAPRDAVQNLRRLAEIGACGDYGFYDSVDYGRQRLASDDDTSPRNERGAIVRTYMVHHQAMSLLAFDNVLHDFVLQRRFHDDPYIRAVTPLLYERIPQAPPVIEEALPEAHERPLRVDATGPGDAQDRFATPDTPYPRTHLLSNGNYALMITNAGGGYSRWRDIDITRWRADTTRDAWGTWIYVRDVESSSVWSATHQPLRRSPRRSSIAFKPERAEFQRRDVEVETITEVTVSPEDDVEIRRVTLINRSSRPRQLEVTSYAEIALAPHNADRAHPAFSKLFVQTEALPERSALIAWRRLRSHDDPVALAAHMVVSSDGQAEANFECETDRSRFIGRGHTPESPAALDSALSNTTGAVLDPIFSLRRRVTVEPGQRVTVAFLTMAAGSREALLPLIEKYADLAAARRAFDLAWNHTQLEMHHLRIQPNDGRLFQHLASHMLFPNSAMRAPARRLRQNRLGQSHLWAYGISGDLPIMVVTLDNERDIGVVRQALLAHTFWRVHGLKTDLVILNEQAQGYEQALSDQLKTLIQAHSHYTGIDTPGGIFLRAASGMPLEDRVLLLAVARVVLVAARGSLAQQLSVGGGDATAHLPARLVMSQRPGEEPSTPLPFMALPYFNSYGGFSPDGREYAIYLGTHQRTPAPWVNVLANPQFGAVVSETGSGFAWYGNSQANRLMPWSNDPISDPSGDAIYIRDEDTGTFWTPTPLPIRELDAYRTRHGQGYTVFEHNSHAIEQHLEVFVPMDDGGGANVRVQRLRLRNTSSRRRRLRVTAYAEWTLGTTREETQAQIVTTWDAAEHILLARNAYHPDYGERYAFLSSSPPPRSFSGDRTEFIGRNGSLANPAAMRRSHLAERCGTALDPCGAVQVLVEIDPGGETEVSFLLGDAASVEEARALVQRLRDPREVERTLRSTQAWWDDLLGELQVEVPDLSATFLINRWLLYQTLACRIFARSALYQSGGAYGFRDQLQDVMALVYAAPHFAREQILRAAAHQFVEGDVQHWWHPPSDAGVRTRFSDDLLWLPYVVAHYVRVTGDRGVLDEVVPFLEMRPLEPDEHEVYMPPQRSQEQATIFEHCRRAIEKGTTIGAHGLPLIGTGDWNDGLNRVGQHGKGESVWMAWFLIEVLNSFAVLCEWPGADEHTQGMARLYRERAAGYAAAVEANAWDGDWYVRAFYDDGTPLGSHTSDEAKIDSLAQSWGVISGAADAQRVARAMEAVDEKLVRPDDKMVLLFTPPFDKSEKDPGYIKGYLPGVRENGGQYTHAAIWVAIAMARRGDGDRAVKLLRMLNPVEHAREPEDVQRYKVEPYVVAADIYALPGRVGQGGWTWYTGSCSWMYRAWIEEVLGFRLRGEQLTIDPVLPRDWDNCKIRYRYRSAHYEITIANPDRVNRGVAWIEIDGKRMADTVIGLQDDGHTHSVTIRLGSPTVPATQNGHASPSTQAVAALAATIVPHDG